MTNSTANKAEYNNDVQDQTSGEEQVKSSDVSEASFDTSRTSKKGKKASGAFRTISEVADLLDVQQHVLRFWETKFTQVRPLKRGGGRRYYRPEDVALLQRIHHLLYTEGYTIKGVQKLLKGQGKAQIIASAGNENMAKVEPKASTTQTEAQPAQQGAGKSKISDTERSALEVMLEELKAMRAMLD